MFQERMSKVLQKNLSIRKKLLEDLKSEQGMLFSHEDMCWLSNRKELRESFSSDGASA